jgi:hypothetical protein
LLVASAYQSCSCDHPAGWCLLGWSVRQSAQLAAMAIVDFLLIRFAFPLLALGSIFSLWIIFFNIFKWTLWLGLSMLLSILQVSFGAYQIFRILLDLSILSCIKFIILLIKIIKKLTKWSELDVKKNKLWNANTYREWSTLAKDIDQQAGRLQWRESTSDFKPATRLRNSTKELQSFRLNGDFRSLMFHLPSYVKRNHLGIEDENLFSACFTGTKLVIDEYIAEIRECCNYLASLNESQLTKSDKLNFFVKISRNLGQSALCLSGGGSLSMYHMGVLRALVESGNYKKVSILEYVQMAFKYIYVSDKSSIWYIRWVYLRSNVRYND